MDKKIQGVALSGEFLKKLKLQPNSSVLLRLERTRILTTSASMRTKG